MRPFNILIVDDDSIIRDVLESLLRNMGFNSIDQAGNGFEALKLLISQEYDLIFLDNAMPEMSGLEFLRRCSCGSILEFSTVIMMTATADGSTIEAIRGEKLKVYDFIVKPINGRLLSGKIDRILRSGKSRPSKRLNSPKNSESANKGIFLTFDTECSGDTVIIRMFGFFLYDDRQLVKNMPDTIACMLEKEIFLDLSNVLMIDEFGIGMLLLTNSVALMANKKFSIFLDEKTIGTKMHQIGLPEIIPVAEKLPEFLKQPLESGEPPEAP